MPFQSFSILSAAPPSKIVAGWGCGLISPPMQNEVNKCWYFIMQSGWVGQYHQNVNRLGNTGHCIPSSRFMFVHPPTSHNLPKTIPQQICSPRVCRWHSRLSSLQDTVGCLPAQRVMASTTLPFPRWPSLWDGMNNDFQKAKGTQSQTTSCTVSVQFQSRAWTNQRCWKLHVTLHDCMIPPSTIPRSCLQHCHWKFTVKPSHGRC